MLLIEIPMAISYFFRMRYNFNPKSAFINPANIIVILNGVKDLVTHEKARFFASLRMTSLQCLLAGLIIIVKITYNKK